MIAFLQKHHKNKSFLNYSNDSLIYAAMKAKDPYILYKLNLDELRPDLLFLVKGAFIGSFDAEDLIRFSKPIGFEILRYIKSNTDLFKEKLNHQLKINYGTPYYELNKQLKSDTKKTICLTLGNISIPEREVKYPNLLLMSQIQSDIYFLLKSAHEETKVELAKMCRNGLVNRQKSPQKKREGTTSHLCSHGWLIPQRAYFIIKRTLM